LPTVDDFLKTWVEDGEVMMEERVLTPERSEELMTGAREKMPEGKGDPVLSVKDLKVWFPLESDLFGRVQRWVKAVDGISFDVFEGQTLGLVGESGCGKTTTGRAILHLVNPTSGSLSYRGQDLSILSDSKFAFTQMFDGQRTATIKQLRRDMQIIFQDPYSSLNPRLTVEQAIVEPMTVHGIGKDAAERRDMAAALLEEVDLSTEYLRRYPHEFSGGQRQRICIARTLSLQPKFIICDESVSALDVSVQAQVLNLLKRLQETRKLTYIFISHDLSVVKFMSDVMLVMKDGIIVEAGASDAIYAGPKQQYTRDLIDAIPRDDIEFIRERHAQRAANLAAR